jgi:LacI family transcriptional regulator
MGQDQRGAGPPTEARQLVRIGDVARAAQVSVATVSKALNNRPDVSAATRERVLREAQRLDFRPDPRARLLSTGRSFAVGLLTTDVYGRFSLPLLFGVEDELADRELAVIFGDTRGEPDRELRKLQTLVSRHVDGIIVNGRRIEDRPPLADSGGIPVVYALTGSQDDRDCSVVPDEAGGARLAVAHLVRSGRRRVAHLTGPRRHRSAVVRASAVREELARHSLTVRGRVRFGTWSEQWGREATAALLANAPDVDAIFCGSDQIARGALDVLRDNGRDVPDDVAVVGFDNWSVMTDGGRPQLSSVDLQIETIGRSAARHLVAAIDGEQPPRRTVVPPRLVLRGSG